MSHARAGAAGSATALPVIELRGIDKWFGEVHANRAVSLAIRPGTIHGIVGENGAGKSTLMGILYGYHLPDRGEILVRGQPAAIRTPQDALAAGIGMVHQHFMLVEPFSVLENVVLGVEELPPRRAWRAPVPSSCVSAASTTSRSTWTRGSRTSGWASASGSRS